MALSFCGRSSVAVNTPSSSVTTTGSSRTKPLFGSTVPTRATTGTVPSVIFDTYVALPSEEGSATPDPSVAKLFSAQSSAYATGGTPDDIVRDYDAQNVDYVLLAKVPRNITPPFIPAMQLDDEAVHSTCRAVAEAVAEHPDRFLG